MVIKKTLIILSILIFSIFNISALCWFNDEPNVDLNDILVYDSNNVFINNLNNLDNIITSGDKLKISYTPTTDNENNINLEQFYIANENIYPNIFLLSYNNLNLPLLYEQSYTLDNFQNKNFYINNTGNNAQLISKNIEYNDGNSQNDFQFSFQINQTGIFKMGIVAKDSCGEEHLVNLPNMEVVPKDNPTSYTCNAITPTIIIPNPTQLTHIDIYIDNGCSNTLDFTSVTNSGFLDVTLRTHEGNNLVEFPAFSCNGHSIGRYLYSAIPNLRIYGNDVYNIHKCGQTFEYFQGLTGNENVTIDWSSGQYQALGIGGWSNYAISNFDKLAIRNTYFNGYFGNIRLLGGGSNIKNFSVTEIGQSAYTTGFQGGYFGNVNITSYNAYNNYFSISGAYNTMYESYPSSWNINNLNGFHDNLIYYGYDSFPLQQIDVTDNVEVYKNTILKSSIYTGNVNPLSFRKMFGEPSIKMYANTFQFRNGITEFSYMDFDSGSYDYIISKNINGKYLGNAWLNDDMEDIFTCNGNINNVSFEGKIYSVCDTPVILAELSMSGVKRIVDYIIVTNENAGGFEPIEEPKKPVGIIEINNYDLNINEIVTWDISSSYDNDGTITNKKFYVDNVLYENINSGQFTSNEAKTFNLKLVVTDNDGLIDTTYRTIQFKKNDEDCLGNIEPYAEIEKTDLGNNLFTFESVNEYDGDNDEIVSKIWTINYEQIQGDKITSTIPFSQDVYLTIFDGCSNYQTYTQVNSTISETPNEYTEPIINLVCSQSAITPVAQIDCNLNYDLRGGNLNIIKWYYDGNELISQTNSTSFSTSAYDTNLHNILVIIESDLNSNQEIYSFQLTSNPLIINDSYTPPIVTPTENVSQSGLGIIDVNNTQKTADNVVAFAGSSLDAIMNFFSPFAVFFVVIVGILGIAVFLGA